MKYICALSKTGNEDIFVFPRAIDHDRMYEVLNGIRVDDNRGGWDREFRKLISAGFVDETGQCHGKSETLNVSSRPDVDSAIFRMQLRNEDVSMGYQPDTKEN